MFYEESDVVQLDPKLQVDRGVPIKVPAYEGRNKGKRKVTLHAGTVLMIKRYFGRSPLPIRMVFMWAILLAVLFVFTSFIHRTSMGSRPERFDWLAVAPIPFLNFLTWALLFPLVYILVQRWPLNTKPLWSKVLLHLLAGFALGTVQELFTNALYLNLLAYAGRFSWSWEVIGEVFLQLPGGILQRAMEYWVLVMILMYVESSRQMSEKGTLLLKLQNQLQAAELSSLKKQLKPHFLFNALNTVSSLMEENVEAAQAVLVRLSEFLRTSLREERADKLPLIQEVSTASHYLAIESVRFKDRLMVEYSIMNDCNQALVPNLILQPLVENAVKHGANTSDPMIQIEIRAERVGDSLRLSVIDDGRGCKDVDAALNSDGIGLKNVKQRIALMYGATGDFRVTSEGSRGFSVVLELPFEVSG